MKESLNNSKQELRRVDHLIYVSLKYTRTVDVLKSVVERMINAYGFMITSLLEFAKHQKRIKAYPETPGLKVELAKQLYCDDKEILKIIDFYVLLRKVIRAEYTSKEEFKRHVTMITNIEGKDIEVDIDHVVEYYKEAKEHVAYIENLINEA